MSQGFFAPILCFREPRSRPASVIALLRHAISCESTRFGYVFLWLSSYITVLLSKYITSIVLHRIYILYCVLRLGICIYMVAMRTCKSSIQSRSSSRSTSQVVLHLRSERAKLSSAYLIVTRHSAQRSPFLGVRGRTPDLVLAFATVFLSTLYAWSRNLLVSCASALNKLTHPWILCLGFAPTGELHLR